MTFTESACAWIWPAEKTLGLIREVEGLEVLRRRRLARGGRHYSHLGNWEVLNHFYCAQCKPIIFYRPPKLKAVDDCCAAARAAGQRVAPSTREGISASSRKSGVVVRLASRRPEPSEAAAIRAFFATQALTSKFVPGMLAGGKAVGVFFTRCAWRTVRATR